MKNKYFLDLSEYQSQSQDIGLDVRSPTASDMQLLAELMFDAYENTIDWDDETLEDALNEVKDYFGIEPLLDDSLLIADDFGIVSACLVTYLTKQKAPLIAYIMTAKRGKEMGMAKRLLQESIRRLHASGYTRVLAGITSGNIPSEKLCESVGFERMNT